MVNPEGIDKYIQQEVQRAEHEVTGGVLSTAIGIPCAVIGIKLFLDAMQAIQGGFQSQPNLPPDGYELFKFMISAPMAGFGFASTVGGVDKVVRGHARLVSAQTAKFINSLRNQETPQS